MTAIVELSAGGARLRVAPHLGARVTRCLLERPGDSPLDLLHPYPEGHADLLRWAKGGMYPMIPYWGRIAQARLLHEGGPVMLQPHPDALPHTLHGTAHQHAWRIAQSTNDRVVLALSHRPDGHWPWSYEAELAYQLKPCELHAQLRVVNTGSAAMPAGLGLHPYLRREGAPRLSFAAGECWPPTPDYLARRAEPLAAPAGREHALQLPDGPFTMFYGKWGGELLAWAGAPGQALRLRASDACSHLVIHQPGGVPFYCAEPVTHTADAFNLAAAGCSGTGSRVLAPGECLSAWISFEYISSMAQTP